MGFGGTRTNITLAILLGVVEREFSRIRMAARLNETSLIALLSCGIVIKFT